MSKVKIFLTDLDGVMTDGGVYYNDDGLISKRFHVHDGMGLEMLRELGVMTGLVTSDDSNIIEHRHKHLKFSQLLKAIPKGNKLKYTKDICEQLEIDLADVAYIGDDVNCWDLLGAVGYPACPANSQPIIKEIPNIFITQLAGGSGAVREFINHLDTNDKLATTKSISNFVRDGFTP